MQLIVFTYLIVSPMFFVNMMLRINFFHFHKFKILLGFSYNIKMVTFCFHCLHPGRYVPHSVVQQKWIQGFLVEDFAGDLVDDFEEPL